MHFNNILPLQSALLKTSLGFMTKILKDMSAHLLRSTCPAHSIAFDLFLLFYSLQGLTNANCHGEVSSGVLLILFT